MKKLLLLLLFASVLGFAQFDFLPFDIDGVQKIYDDELAIDLKPLKGKGFDDEDDWERSSDKKEIRKLNIKDIRRYDRGHLY